MNSVSVSFAVNDIAAALALIANASKLAPVAGFRFDESYTSGGVTATGVQAAAPSEAPEKSQAKPKSATTARSQPTAEAAPSKPAPSKPAPSDAAPATSTEATKPTAAAVSAADAVDYPTLQKAVAKLFAKDAKAPVQIAKDLGYDTFKAMPADVWGKALDAVNSKLAELEIA